MASDRDPEDSWAEAFDRDGYVEVALSKRKAALTFALIAVLLFVPGLLMLGFAGAVAMVSGGAIFVAIVLLALLPHLEAAIATGSTERSCSASFKPARQREAPSRLVGGTAHRAFVAKPQGLIGVVPEAEDDVGALVSSHNAAGGGELT